MSTPTATAKVNNAAYDVSANQWNAVVNAVKNQPYSYIVYKDGSAYYARNGATGTLTYGGTTDEGGVDGDDTTEVLQACISAGGTSVMQNLGTVTLTGSLDFGTGTKYTRLTGVGTNLLDGEALADYAFKLGDGATALQQVLLEGFTLKGGMQLNKINYVFLDRMKLTNSGAARYNFETVGLAYSININRCIIQYGESGGIDILGDTTDVQIQNSLLYNNDNYDIRIYGTGSPYRRGITISGNWIEHTAASESNMLQIESADSIFVTCNHLVNVHGATSDGVVLTGGTLRSKIFGNWIFTPSTGRYGIHVDAATRCEIFGNYIAAQDDEIYLSSNSGKNLVFGNDCDVIDNDQASTATNVRNRVFENYGYVTENNGYSTGTGAQQTIAHGCAFTPTATQVLLSERTTGGALAYQSSAPDATNIYVTATNAKDYNWRIET